MKNESSADNVPGNIFIGEKYFDDTDQLIFSRLSGDRNPIHTDELLARRYITGQRVAYGIHVVLWALEYWFAKNTENFQTINCTFKNPIYLGEKVVFFCEKNNKQSIIRVYVDDLLCIKIILSFVTENDKDKEIISKSDSGHAGYTLVKTPAKPLDVSPAEEIGKKYKVILPDAADMPVFPLCNTRLGRHKISAICSLSFFMGMICPGLYSLLSTIKINLLPSVSHDDHLFYSIDGFDQRFQLFHISVSGVISGYMTVFKRPAPAQQIRVTEAATHVLPHEFNKTTSLIIGGSRGLGEYTAKLLVAGGGDVILTYAQGQTDAQDVCDDLNAFREGSCKIKKYDVLSDQIETLLAEDIDLLTAVYYFATPKIFRKKSGTFNTKLFDEFFLVYVSKFDLLCACLQASVKKPIKVFLPSSTAITETIDALVEYSAAKMAAEQLAEKINQAHGFVSVLVSRLPRMDTDQTATLPSVQSVSTLEIMLPLIRTINNKNSKKN
jgi:hypothetical protein